MQTKLHVKGKGQFSKYSKVTCLVLGSGPAKPIQSGLGTSLSGLSECSQSLKTQT